MLAPGCRPADVLNAFFFSKCEKGMLLAPCDEPVMAVSFGKFGQFGLIEVPFGN